MKCRNLPRKLNNMAESGERENGTMWLGCDGTRSYEILTFPSQSKVIRTLSIDEWTTVSSENAVVMCGSRVFPEAMKGGLTKPSGQSADRGAGVSISMNKKKVGQNWKENIQMKLSMCWLPRTRKHLPTSAQEETVKLSDMPKHRDYYLPRAFHQKPVCKNHREPTELANSCIKTNPLPALHCTLAQFIRGNSTNYCCLRIFQTIVSEDAGQSIRPLWTTLEADNSFASLVAGNLH